MVVKARRVRRLRDLIARIEGLPVSPDRDRLLSEFRSRAVDVDTGVTPRAILPMREPGSVAALDDRPPSRDRSRNVARSTPPAAAPAVEPAQPAPAAARPEHVDEPYWGDERLSLEDSLPAEARGAGGQAVPPWTLGLRG